VLPHCKPDAGSFGTVLASIGARPGECVMVEDSMKNVRAAKALGMRTILVVGRGRGRGRGGIGGHRRGVGGARQAAVDDDAPDETDPAVDAAVEVASEVADVLKMWLDP
jgi:putative hydrolase of the HAD superfamily